ncbi:hypothetical protein [Streptomyces sp. TP-A0356]|uniref:hypothetical protein n=1 Tax=Streptomyces sp. TP-A0356 TaxID=1359208 RepID=UPI0006E18F13|nr:hypothetical protein [Streptomyces sp. TP-A0356]
MRSPRRFAPAFLAIALVTALPYDAMPHARGKHSISRARMKPGQPADPGPFGSECRVHVTGSHVVAYCHNPYPETDHVGLHIECDPWWDLDTDSAPADAGPAMTVRLTGRCWQQVRSAWVSHAR